MRKPFDGSQIHATMVTGDEGVMRTYDAVSAYPPAQDCTRHRQTFVPYNALSAEPESPAPDAQRAPAVEEDEEVTQRYGSAPSLLTQPLYPRNGDVDTLVSAEAAAKPFWASDRVLRLVALAGLLALSWELTWPRTVAVFCLTLVLVMLGRKVT